MWSSFCLGILIVISLGMHLGIHHPQDCKISTLLDIIDIYGLRQLIAEPTKISNTSQTLIDLCITNSLNVIDSGVYHRGLSDHYLVYMTRKS